MTGPSTPAKLTELAALIFENMLNPKLQYKLYMICSELRELDGAIEELNGVLAKLITEQNERQILLGLVLLVSVSRQFPEILTEISVDLIQRLHQIKDGNPSDPVLAGVVHLICIIEDIGVPNDPIMIRYPLSAYDITTAKENLFSAPRDREPATAQRLSPSTPVLDEIERTRLALLSQLRVAEMENFESVSDHLAVLLNSYKRALAESQKYNGPLAKSILPDREFGFYIFGQLLAKNRALAPSDLPLISKAANRIFAAPLPQQPDPLEISQTFDENSHEKSQLSAPRGFDSLFSNNPPAEKPKTNTFFSRHASPSSETSFSRKAPAGGVSLVFSRRPSRGPPAANSSMLTARSKESTIDKKAEENSGGLRATEKLLGYSMTPLVFTGVSARSAEYDKASSSYLLRSNAAGNRLAFGETQMIDINKVEEESQRSSEELRESDLHDRFTEENNIENFPGEDIKDQYSEEDNLENLQRQDAEDREANDTMKGIPVETIRERNDKDMSDTLSDEIVSLRAQLSACQSENALLRESLSVFPVIVSQLRETCESAKKENEAFCARMKGAFRLFAAQIRRCQTAKVVEAQHVGFLAGLDASRPSDVISKKEKAKEAGPDLRGALEAVAELRASAGSVVESTRCELRDFRRWLVGCESISTGLFSLRRENARQAAALTRLRSALHTTQQESLDLRERLAESEATAKRLAAAAAEGRRLQGAASEARRLEAENQALTKLNKDFAGQLLEAKEMMLRGENKSEGNRMAITLRALEKENEGLERELRRLRQSSKLKEETESVVIRTGKVTDIPNGRIADIPTGIAALKKFDRLFEIHAGRSQTPF